MADATEVKALLFDVFGTVVDWRGSVARELAAFGAARGLDRDWTELADDWRGLYHPSMEEVSSGRRPWTILDVLHRESLQMVLSRHAIDGVCEAELDHLTCAWHRLDPWPDSVAGLTRLKSSYIIGTLSNGNVGLLTRMAKWGGLPWDVVLSAETAQAYKPTPQSYLRNAQLLNLEPFQVMLVAAHNRDLQAASAVGLRTGFVVRPNEHGPAQTRDLAAEGDWDVVADSFLDLADKLGCR